MSRSPYLARAAILVVAAIVLVPSGRAIRADDIDDSSAAKAVEGGAFLSQFAGKKRGDEVEVGKDIKVAPGAEGESREVALAVKKAIAVMNAVFGRD